MRCGNELGGDANRSPKVHALCACSFACSKAPVVAYTQRCCVAELTLQEARVCRAAKDGDAQGLEKLLKDGAAVNILLDSYDLTVCVCVRA